MLHPAELNGDGPERPVVAASFVLFSIMQCRRSVAIVASFRLQNADDLSLYRSAIDG